MYDHAREPLRCGAVKVRDGYQSLPGTSKGPHTLPTVRHVSNLHRLGRLQEHFRTDRRPGARFGPQSRHPYCSIPTTHTKTVTSFKYTDWKQFRKTIDEHITLHNAISSPEAIDKAVEDLTAVIQLARRRHSTVCRINSAREDLPRYILNALRERNRLHRYFQRTGCRATLDELKDTQRNIQIMLKHQNTKIKCDTGNSLPSAQESSLFGPFRSS